MEKYGHVALLVVFFGFQMFSRFWCFQGLSRLAPDEEMMIRVKGKKASRMIPWFSPFVGFPIFPRRIYATGLSVARVIRNIAGLKSSSGPFLSLLKRFMKNIWPAIPGPTQRRNEVFGDGLTRAHPLQPPRATTGYR